MLRTLSSYLLCLAILLPIFAGRLYAQTARSSWPNSDNSAATCKLVVLRNGEVLHGDVLTAGERILVRLPGREISLRLADVEVVVPTLDEAYLLKRSKTPPTDIEGLLDLAAWCLRHNLCSYAAVELAAAREVQPRSPRLLDLERRLQNARPTDTTTTAKAAKKTAVPKRDAVRRAAAAESPLALERFVRGLPTSAVEKFTGLQPTITHGCATAGCHAPGNGTSFTLLRLPLGTAVSRRVTQRNLYNTAQLVDFSKPEDSRLLQIASRPHGPLKSGVFGDARAPKYRELVAWIAALTGAPMNGGDPTNENGFGNFARYDTPRDVNQVGFDSAARDLEPNRPAQIKVGSEISSSAARRRTGRSRGGPAAPTATGAARNSAATYGPSSTISRTASARRN